MRKLLLVCILFCPLVHSQTVPPPPPLFAYEVDYDNDGTVWLDLELFTQFVTIPRHEDYYDIDLSGYTVQYDDFNNTILSGTVSFTQSLEMYYNFFYSGPEYDTAMLNNTYPAIYVERLAFDGDWDTDGIINGLEDTNANGFIYDDDSDSDGIANFEDPDVLSVSSNQFKEVVIFPNPANSSLNFYAVKNQIDFVKIIDLTGKIFLQKQNPAENIDISMLSPGVYMVRLTFGDKTSDQKLVVK
ncbi:T9SS type A sorting domain-containing protein [Flavobacterium silvaticum]|uniref:T9SS type A sorting domain-containing protein n=1 Tax=Flavobacterium silvaticum TaxID=1852020 RepID=A0A972FTB2_9FLAO|nr:T9SS type A sorting domain-containing protein [Flavobacterium silvaticum]NMH28103.1 T9SS type A sorting domain-containing protein [Flavobacterium silvaticum]